MALLHLQPELFDQATSVVDTIGIHPVLQVSSSPYEYVFALLDLRQAYVIRRLLFNDLEGFQNPSIRACLQQYVPRRRWIAAAQHAAFYAEGSAVSRRLHWAQSRSLEALGIEAELSTAEVKQDGVEPFIGAIRSSLDQLNAIRTQLLLTVGAHAG